MNMHLVAFLVGLVTLAKADVSHLKQASFASNSLSDDVAIRFNNAAGNSRYWWQNTQTSPFTKTAHQQHQQQPQHISHEQNHIQNPHFNVKTQHFPSQQQRSNAYANMATLSGSPSEVNSLTHDTAQQTNHIADQYRPFVPKIPCYGATQVCAPKAACQHGFIREADLGLVQSQANNCDSQLEACCSIEADIAPAQDDQLASCADANSACVASKFCFNGFIDQSVEHKAVRSPTCVAPAVCCRFSDRKRAAPSFQDSDFAAAGSTSEVLTKEGYVVNVPSNQYLPSFPEPAQPEYNPDSSNDDPSKLRPETPRPVQPTPAPRPQCSNGAPDSSYPDCCTNGGRGQYCCQNGANNPDCCANPNGRGRYCCDNGLDTPDCKAPNVPGPQPVPQQPTYAPVPQQPATRPPTAAPRPVVTQRPYVQQPSNPQPSVAFQDQATNIVPSACPAAMNCTLIEYCDAIATISKTPVQLNDFQKSFRVPMTDCMIMPSRELGKCCRDPDYTDPWPVGRLGQYNADELNAVFDSGAYKPEGQKAASTNQVNVRVVAPNNQQRVAPQQQQARPYRAIANSVQPAINKPFQPQPIQPTVQTTCGVRNYNTQPRGKAPLGTGFGEFTWVAMVILESKKALLCGGSIVDKNVVVTAADCVQGHRHNDVLIKAGEWRLGSDEEPKPFQIVRVQRIVNHPQYNPQTLENNVAILYLENDIKYDTHIGPICLDDSAPTASDNCVTTGWSKEVLKVHLGNALMQHTRVSVLPPVDCQSRLESSRLGFLESTICGVTEQDACQVDPGSALACADASGRYSLKGVYSTETGCNEPNQVVAYTRTDLQWIGEFLRNSARAY